MDTRTGQPADPTSLQVDQELSLIRDAISMVASGGSRRVVVAGLRIGEPLLEQARAMGLAAGVRIVPLWSADEGGLDIAVEQIAE